MSSLAATQADGYYIPPAYLESGAYKKKSLNQYNNSKGHNQYLTRSVCRFELPFDGFCTLCDAIVGKGTRFNAHKSHVGDYYTTKIYEFVTKCRSCGECEFRIRTNPSDRTFDYVGGIRRKVEEFDTADAGTHGVIDTEFGNGILRYENGRVEGPGVEDARHDAAMAASSSTTTTTTSSSSMLRLLERDVVGHRTSQTEHGRMSTLLRINSRMIDDACANASIRKSFREDRRAKRRRFERASDLGLGKGIELLDDDDDDDGGGGGGGGGGRGGGGRGGTTTRGEEDAIAARSAMDSRRRMEDASRARASERMRFGNARAGGIFGSTRPPGGGGLRGSGGGGTTAATTVRNDPGNSNEKLVERKRRGSAHAGVIGVVVLRKSGPKRKNTAENNGHDRKHNRPPSPLGETIVDGKSSHASGGGALALLSSCYASDSDSND